MIYKIVFSCAGGTAKVADAIASGFGEESRLIDLTARDFIPPVLESANDIVLLAVPVWGGRVPALAIERLKQLHGCGQPAIAIVVYGNRDYDDALLELCDVAVQQGFTLVSAGAFIAEHCIFPSVATARPDDADYRSISDFASKCMSAISRNNVLNPAKVKGKRPYKTAAGVPLYPHTDSAKCAKCGVCVSQCPAGAIDSSTLATDKSLCTSCCRCISVCTQGARLFGGIGYATVRFAFSKMCAKRREPEFYF